MPVAGDNDVATGVVCVAAAMSETLHQQFSKDAITPFEYVRKMRDVWQMAAHQVHA